MLYKAYKAVMYGCQQCNYMQKDASLMSLTVLSAYNGYIT